MNMQEFYDFHGISRSQFAGMIGVRVSTLYHYELGHKISDEAMIRVGIGIDIMEDLKLRYSDRTPCPRWEQYARDYENKRVNDVFKHNFDRIVLIEL